MKLPDYARAIGISYTTASRWWKASCSHIQHDKRKAVWGIVDYVPNLPSAKSEQNRVAIYSRVSSSENKENLERQSQRLTEYATVKGYQIVKIVKEVGSGLNDNRKQLESLLKQDDYNILLVEHKNRHARFWTHYLEVLLGRLGVKLEIVNKRR
jgi:putative resolvase